MHIQMNKRVLFAKQKTSGGSMLLLKRKFKIPVIKEDIVGGAMPSNRIVGMITSRIKPVPSSSMASSIIGGDIMDFSKSVKRNARKKDDENIKFVY